MPACAKACPTRSIRFGELEELRREAQVRVEDLQNRGYNDAQIYDPTGSSVGGTHAMFVILGEPEAYNFPPAPEVPTIHLASAWSAALISALAVLLVVCVAFATYPPLNISCAYVSRRLLIMAEPMHITEERLEAIREEAARN